MNVLEKYIYMHYNAYNSEVNTAVIVYTLEIEIR